MLGLASLTAESSPTGPSNLDASEWSRVMSSGARYQAVDRSALLGTSGALSVRLRNPRCIPPVARDAAKPPPQPVELSVKVGILGSGTVGQTLAEGFAKKGHDVMVGTGSPAKLAEWAAKVGNLQVGTYEETAAFGELLVLAVKGSVANVVLGGITAENLSGKVLIDATNPISDAAPEHGVLKYFTTLDSSSMEKLQRAYPWARFVKAFNSVGAARMVDPVYKEGRPTMFICGDDPTAKDTVTQVLEQFGWEAADMGPAEAARAIEPLCMLWCIPGFIRNEWTHAFKLLHD